jgi:hypothetical protein
MPDFEGAFWSHMNWPNGAYGKTHGNTWMVKTPTGHVGNLSKHEVTENEDGTITVSPSILVSDHTGELYHGWLIGGTWT